MPEQKIPLTRKEQEKIKQLVEDVIPDYLNNDMKKGEN